MYDFYSTIASDGDCAKQQCLQKLGRHNRWSDVATERFQAYIFPFYQAK
jgi:hypothetical protein